MFIFRIISSIFLILVFAGAVFWHTYYGYVIGIVFASLMTFLMIKEFLCLLAAVKKHAYILPTALCGTITVISVFLSLFYPTLPEIVFALCIIIAWISILFSIKNQGSFEKILHSIAGGALSLLPMVFIAKLFIIGEGDSYIGRSLIFSLITLTKSGDIGAYLVGTLTNSLMKGGNHKAFPVISPKKSWEGVAGGLIFTIAVAFILRYFHFMDRISSDIYLIIFAVILFFFGMLGDLAESSLKRICDIKDSGRILPGLGGVLDVTDSMLFNAPIFYFCYLLF